MYLDFKQKIMNVNEKDFYRNTNNYIQCKS